MADFLAWKRSLPAQAGRTPCSVALSADGARLFLLWLFWGLGVLGDTGRAQTRGTRIWTAGKILRENGQEAGGVKA